MIEDSSPEGTSGMKRSRSRRRVKVSADGRGVVSHAGAGLLRELAAGTGLAGAVTGALLDTYRGFPLHMPGQVFADLAVAIADGAGAVTGIEVLRDRESLFGPVASMPAAWRLLDRIDGVHLGRVRAARAAARERAWEAGAAPKPGTELRIDFDATITIAHSEKQNAAATWKKTFGLLTELPGLSSRFGGRVWCGPVTVRGHDRARRAWPGLGQAAHPAGGEPSRHG
jgi:Transposase DDE domain group 1